MTPAEREALEVADLRAQIGPLFDLYMACIELIEEGGADMVHSNLHDALCLAVVVRKKLGLPAPWSRPRGISFRSSGLTGRL